MAQQIVPAAKLVPRYHTIGRCNNYDVLQSIPCSTECKIVGKILLEHPLSYALTATANVPVVYLQQFSRTVSKVHDTEDTIKFMLDTKKFTYTVDMFRDTLYFPVETPENLFVAQVNIQTIKAFMHRIGYQGMVDKTKINILQLFHAVINRTNVDYAALLWTDEDYYSIKDDIPLVSLYTIRNVLVRGMLIPDEFLTKEISVADDFKKYETVFINVDVLMNQSQPVVSTQGTHMITPGAYRTPILTTASPQDKKRKQSVGETSSLKKSLKLTIRQKRVDEGEKYNQSYDDVDDFDDRLEPKSHKENPEHVDDDDDKEKVDKKKNDEICSLETRTEEIQTLIPTPTRSPRTILSSDKNITQELTNTVSLPTATTSKDPHSKRRISTPKIIEELFKNYVQNNVIQVHPTTTTSTETTSSADLEQQLYLKMKISLQDQANDPALWEVLKRKFEKSSTSNTSCRDDEFHLHGHDDH
ncbi:hypothetical protein Tco_1012486 [Tanacetum coccineum]